jgi:hypothetical protein
MPFSFLPGGLRGRRGDRAGGGRDGGGAQRGTGPAGSERAAHYLLLEIDSQLTWAMGG